MINVQFRPVSIVECPKYLKEIYSKNPYPLYSRLQFPDHHPDHPIDLVLIHQNKSQVDVSSAATIYRYIDYIVISKFAIQYNKENIVYYGLVVA